MSKASNGLSSRSQGLKFNEAVENLNTALEGGVAEVSKKLFRGLSKACFAYFESCFEYLGYWFVTGSQVEKRTVGLLESLTGFTTFRESSGRALTCHAL